MKKTKTKTKNTKKQVGAKIFDGKGREENPVPMPVFRRGKIGLEGNDF
jgi:hypothetical protein